MYLFFDTETTGLPKDYNAPAEKLDNWPRVIQLAFIVCNEKEEIMHEFCHLIKPDGWRMPTEKWWVDKGYTQERSEAMGIPIKIAVEALIEERKKHPYAIGHNINFDRLVLRSEIIRMGIQVGFKGKNLYTMMSATNHAKIPNARGTGYKWPKLEELYKILFGEELSGAHDALVDIKATARCFFEMKKRGWITL